MELDLEILKLVHLAALYEQESEVIKRIKAFVNTNDSGAYFDNFEKKEFNYDFSDNRQDYTYPDLLLRYKSSPKLLERFFKGLDHSLEGLEKFEHYLDSMVALNHKLSGCVKYIERLDKALMLEKENMSEEDKKRLEDEMDRIEAKIDKVAKYWGKVLKDSIVIYEEVRKLIFKKQDYSEKDRLKIQDVYNYSKKSFEEYIEKLERSEEGLDGIYRKLMASRRKEQFNEKLLKRYRSSNRYGEKNLQW